MITVCGLYIYIYILGFILASNPSSFNFQTVCLIGVIEKYKELAKYNLRQLTSSKTQDEALQLN